MDKSAMRNNACLRLRGRTAARLVSRAVFASVLLAACLMFLASGAAGEPGSQPALLLGAAWYPEQWPESRWDADLQLMEDAHLHVVRVGEFAWSTMEPSPGHYSFAWLARAIRLAEKHHIAVVIGTPTDAPPAWLTSAHPEILRVDAAGHRAEHGGRRQFNYASPEYRVFCATIAGQLAQRFGHDPAVIGWQIGNEYTDESFDPQTRRQFASPNLLTWFTGTESPVCLPPRPKLPVHAL